MKLTILLDKRKPCQIKRQPGCHMFGVKESPTVYMLLLPYRSIDREGIRYLHLSYLEYASWHNLQQGTSPL